MTASASTAGLEIKLLGPLEVRIGGEAVPLPRSKKTRALLAYLVATGQEHSRDRLCMLLWDSTDDPRGALRWSLSKLRRVVDANLTQPKGTQSRIEADGQRVVFRATGVRIDVTELEAIVASGVSEAMLERLEAIAEAARGEFLEGLDLPDLFEFQAWCIACRERSREGLCVVLSELVRRLSSDAPQRALPHARAWVRADAYGVTAHSRLLELLVRAGKRDEAQQQYALSRRLLREMSATDASTLDRAWRSLGSEPSALVSTTTPPPVPAPVPSIEAERRTSHFVGRQRETSRLGDLLDTVRTGQAARVALVIGEPGAGKSRLAAELVARAEGVGVSVLRGKSYEAESSRPFGPWVDALGVDIHWPTSSRDDATPTTREGLFASVAAAVERRAAAHRGALLMLDDIQWLDRDSAELLHFVARSIPEAPLLVLLLARSGELEDNESAMRVMRSLRREASAETLELRPLARDEIAELLTPFELADVDKIYGASAGNPLYALELARTGSEPRRSDSWSSSIYDLVQERVERLPAEAAEVLRWGSVLGHAFAVSRLSALSTLEGGELVMALERLEQHALLQSDPEERYLFAHDVVREAVYASLSQPRRRLMHQQVAKLLERQIADSEVATEVAHHAQLAGDASLGVRACVEAGHRSLRLFANADAEALARRGLELAQGLDRSEQVAATLELLHVLYSAKTPDREAASARVSGLALEALDLGLTEAARLGFQMLSFLRWESSSMADAHANIMQAERVSRSAATPERATALSQAARCLVLLERNLEQAEAFVLEVKALADRGGELTSETHFATAMLHEHRGELEAAAKAFRDARWAARERGHRLAEFQAIEHWTMLEIDRGAADEAFLLATELASLGERVREGAERPSSQALLALAQRLGGTNKQPDFADKLEDALEELKRVDAKYPLAFVRTRLARLELEAGDWEAAHRHASAGLEHASAIGRRSDMALARTLLTQCAEIAGDTQAAQEHRAALAELAETGLSAQARRQLTQLEATTDR